MWNVRQGDAWSNDILQTVDPAYFNCQFGDLNSVNFNDFDCIVPLALRDYDALDNNQILSGKRFWAPKSQIVNICDDKLVLNRLLLGGDYAELVPSLREKNSGQFPYIAKRRQDQWGVNSFIIRNSDDERARSTIPVVRLFLPNVCCWN